jgi:pullulanase/glycogen debranching enzyme
MKTNVILKEEIPEKHAKRQKPVWQLLINYIQCDDGTTRIDILPVAKNENPQLEKEAERIRQLYNLVGWVIDLPM